MKYYYVLVADDGSEEPKTILAKDDQDAIAILLHIWGNNLLYIYAENFDKSVRCVWNAEFNNIDGI